jgi:hypothetical protein
MQGHRQYLDLAAASVDATLSPAESALLAEHVASCASCRRLAADLAADDRLLRQVGNDRPPVRIRDVVVEAVAEPHARSRRSWPLGLVAAASLVVVALVGGLLAGASFPLVRDLADDTHDPVWSRLATSEFDAGSGASEVLAMARTPGIPGIGIVAVGRGATGGRMWLSGDGRTWSVPDLPPDFARARLEAVATSHGRIFIAGSIVDPGGRPSGSIWSSDDGLTWTSSVVATNGLTTVAAAPTRIVAAGAGHADGSPLVTSSDGRSWQLLADGGSLSGAIITGLTVAGPGFVAVGYDDVGGAVWTSVDGLAWERAPDPGFAGSRLMATAASPGGIVAVGFRGDAPTAWLSLDGVAWTPATGADDGSGRMQSVAASALGMVAVGPSIGPARSWLSTDGREWRPLDDDGFGGSADLSAVVGIGDAVATAGRVDGRAAIWVGARD